MVFYGTDNLPTFQNPVITIGSFDGVHHGHKTILRKLAKTAKEIDGESILITFEPHPRKIINPNPSLGLLSSPQQKINLVQSENIDHIVFIAFSRDFSMLSAEAYVQDFLLKKFKPAKIVIGYDHKFGHDRAGDINVLRQLTQGICEIEEIEPQWIHDATVSSSKIRKALLSGNIKVANSMLERNYAFDAMVIKGEGIGKKIGFPTANLQPIYTDQLVPGLGVYVVAVIWNDKSYKGMLNIGKRPTVTDDNKITIEVNILDFDENIYGRQLTLSFIDYIRPEMKFASLDLLIEQLKIDEKTVREYKIH